MPIFLIIFSVLLISFFLRIERNVYRGDRLVLSPLFVLSVPILTIIIISYILGPILGFYTVGKLAIIYNLIAFSAFWCGGICILFLKKPCRPAIRIESKETNKSSIPNIVIAIIVLVVFLQVFFLRSTLGTRSLTEIGDGEFSQGGIESHLGNIVTIAIIVLILSMRMRILSFSKIISGGLLLLCLVLKLASSIKGEVILPIISGVIILLIYRKIKPNLKNIFIILLVVFALFTVMALFFNITDNEKDLWNYVLNFIYFYFTSGETGFSQYLEHFSYPLGNNPSFAYMFFANVYEKILGDGQLMTTLDSAGGWVEISTNQNVFNFKTNVFSLVGEVIINSGVTLSLLFFFLLGILCYYIFTRRNDSVFMAVWYAYIAGCLLLGFFSSTYILQPNFVYCQFICWIFNILCKLK